MLFGYKFPRAGNECNKNMNWVQVNVHLTQKWEENILKFYFCIRAPTFLTHMPCPLNICFTNKVNTICGGRQLLVTGSQCPSVPLPGCRVSGSNVPGSQAPRPRVPSLRVPDPKASGLRVSGPRSQVLILDYAFCLCVYLLWTFF